MLATVAADGTLIVQLHQLPLEERKEEQHMSHASQLVLAATGQCLATSK